MGRVTGSLWHGCTVGVRRSLNTVRAPRWTNLCSSRGVRLSIRASLDKLPGSRNALSRHRAPEASTVSGYPRPSASLRAALHKSGAFGKRRSLNLQQPILLHSDHDRSDLVSCPRVRRRTRCDNYLHHGSSGSAVAATNALQRFRCERTVSSLLQRCCAPGLNAHLRLRRPWPGSD